MASRTSKADTVKAVTTLEDFGRDIVRRRADTGITDLPRNSGECRTPGKKALLKAIEKAGGRW